MKRNNLTAEGRSEKFKKRSGKKTGKNQLIGGGGKRKDANEKLGKNNQ